MLLSKYDMVHQDVTGAWVNCDDPWELPARWRAATPQEIAGHLADMAIRAEVDVHPTLYPVPVRAQMSPEGYWLMVDSTGVGGWFVRDATLEEIIASRLFEVGNLRADLRNVPPFAGDWLRIPRPSTPLRAAIWQARRFAAGIGDDQPVTLGGYTL